MPDFMSIKKIVGKIKAEGQGNYSQGIGNQGEQVAPASSGEHTARANLILRGLQIFFALVTLFIAVYMATFQTKWIGAPSGLTGFIIFLASISMLASIILLLVPFIHERSGYKHLKGVYRVVSEARVGVMTNGIFALLSLILAVTQTISAYTSPGCKDPTKDPHAGGKDKSKFISELGGWCRTKRAEAAFCWFLWIPWLLSLIIFLRQWRMERKQGPRIPPFVHPTEDSAFEPINDLDDQDAFGDENAVKYGGRYGEGGDGNYAAALPDYQRRDNPLADIEAKYGMNRTPPYESNPFADRPQYGRPSYDYNAYDSADPYSAIQQQLTTARPDLPPQLPDLGYGPRYR